MAEPIDAVLADAARLTAAGRPQDAIETLRPVIADHPDHPGAWCGLAAALLDVGDAQHCLDAAKRAITLGEPSWAHRLASLALTELGRHEEAAISARESARRSPGDWRGYVTLAEALDPIAPAEALAAARRAVAAAPEEPRTHEVLGAVAERAGESDIAREAYAESLRLDSTNPEVRAALARLGRKTSTGGRFGDVPWERVTAWQDAVPEEPVEPDWTLVDAEPVRFGGESAERFSKARRKGARPAAAHSGANGSGANGSAANGSGANGSGVNGSGRGAGTARFGEGFEDEVREDAGRFDPGAGRFDKGRPRKGKGAGKVRYEDLGRADGFGTRRSPAPEDDEFGAESKGRNGSRTASDDERPRFAEGAVDGGTERVVRGGATTRRDPRFGRARRIGLWLVLRRCAGWLTVGSFVLLIAGMPTPSPLLAWFALGLLVAVAGIGGLAVFRQPADLRLTPTFLWARDRVMAVAAGVLVLGLGVLALWTAALALGSTSMTLLSPVIILGLLALLIGSFGLWRMHSHRTR